MRKLSFVAAVISVMMWCGTSTALPYVEGEVLVKFLGSASDAEIAALNAEIGTEIVKYLEPISVYHLRATGVKTAPELVVQYRESSLVVYAEKNYRRTSSDETDPNDPKYADGTQWYPNTPLRPLPTARTE